MTLGEQQEKFMRALPILLLYAQYLGYGVRSGQLKRCENCTVGRVHSVHKIALAIDLNIFSPAGDYVIDGTGHDQLHDLWDLLGGAKRIEGDMNHYSLAWKGMW